MRALTCRFVDDQYSGDCIRAINHIVLRRNLPGVHIAAQTRSILVSNMALHSTKSETNRSLSEVTPIKRRILLVDDDAAVLLTLKAVLELNLFEVDTAASFAEAEKKLTTGFYHMVITDARMESETAGVDVIRAARQQPYNPATALLTAYPPSNGDWHEAQTLLVKPIGMQDLLRQIEALLIRHEDEKQLLANAPASKIRHVGMNGERRRKVI